MKFDTCGCMKVWCTTSRHGTFPYQIDRTAVQLAQQHLPQKCTGFLTMSLRVNSNVAEIRDNTINNLMGIGKF